MSLRKEFLEALEEAELDWKYRLSKGKHEEK